MIFRFLLLVVWLYSKCNSLTVTRLGCSTTVTKTRCWSTSTVNHNDAESRFSELLSIFENHGLPENKSKALICKLQYVGWISTSDIFNFARDFESKPEILSNILRLDFNFSPLDAHRLRATMLEIVSIRGGRKSVQKDALTGMSDVDSKKDVLVVDIEKKFTDAGVDSTTNTEIKLVKEPSRPVFKSCNVVRRLSTTTDGSYGLSDQDVSE